MSESTGIYRGASGRDGDRRCRENFGYQAGGDSSANAVLCWEQARDGGAGCSGKCGGGEVSSFVAEVIDIREESRVAGRQRWQIALDRTEFGAGDMGVLEAVARSGAKLVVPVLGVVIEAGEVWHLVEKPLAAGTAVTERVGRVAG